MERRQLDPAVAVRGPHDGDVRSDAVQPDELVHPFTLDCCLAVQFQAQFDEERDSSREILDHNAGVIHPVDRHATQLRRPRILAVDEHRDGPDQPSRWGALTARQRVCADPIRLNALASPAARELGHAPLFDWPS